MSTETAKNSIVKYIGRQILSSRQSALFIAVVFSFMPFLSVLSVIAISLVSLRKGATEGLYVVLAVLLPAIAIGAYQDQLLPTVTRAMIFLLGTWFLSVVLRETQSWSLALLSAVLISMLVSSAILVFNPDYVIQAKTSMLKVIDYWQKQGSDQFDFSELRTNINRFAPYMLGVQIVVVMLSTLFNVSLARNMQSKLFNPGGFSQECLNFRLDKLSLGLFLLSLLSLVSASVLSKALVLITGMPLLLAGLSLAHWRIRRWKVGKWFMVIPGYIFIIAFLPLSLILVMIVGLADFLFNFRDYHPQAKVL